LHRRYAPLAAWYLHKADQCARLAKDTTDPRKRCDFETEGKLWLQIAEQIEMDEVRWFWTSADVTQTASTPPR
jgi:hypothetical protein